MIDEHTLMNVQAILGDIERGETNACCDKLAITFGQIAQDCNNLTTERRTEISWEATVCRLIVGPAIYRDNNPAGFTSLPDITEDGRAYLAERIKTIHNPFLIARYSDYLQQVGYGKKNEHALRAIDAYLTSCARLVLLTVTRDAIYLMDSFDRAVQLALQYKNPSKLEKCTQEGMDLIRLLKGATGNFGAVTTSVGRWTHELMKILFHIR